MEPEVKEFLKRITYTIFIGLVWMAINSTLGIMYDLAFIHGKISLGNILFYLWFIASIALMLWAFVRLWKKSLEQ